jgi:putative ABC transport system substrate-binding protein
VAVPVAKSSEVLLSAQVLINKKIDVIYQISDNTINDSFEALGMVAAENAVPLFGGFLQSTELGACAALGWDFFNMGYKTGKIALKVKEGISPENIPFQYMSNIQLYINLEVAKKQGVVFSEEILKRADKLISQ